MENWTDKAIRQHIEELIEESYLMSLTEQEIRDYLRNFVKACEAILNENISAHGDIRLTKVKVTLLKSHLLFTGDTKPPDETVGADGSIPDRISFLAQHVIQIKSTVVRLLDMINPAITRAVLDEHRMRMERIAQTRKTGRRVRNLYIKTGYYILLLIDIILLLMVVMNRL